MGMKWKKCLGIALSFAMTVGVMAGPAITAHADYSSTYSFAGGFDGWTTIDADGDGYTWMMASDLLALEVDDSNYWGLGSFSYINYDGAYDPENYLVSPQVTLGGKIEFYAACGNHEYPEHIGVFVSEGAPDPSEFALVQDFHVNSYDEWSYYSVDLSAYSGEGYVAICHYDSYDEYFVVVRDVTITQPGEIISDPSTGTSWLDPIRSKFHEQGRLVENGAESAALEISGSFSLPLEFMVYLKNHPNLTLTYHVTYKEESFDVVIPGSAAIADASIEWYGPLWLKAHYCGISEAQAQSGTYVVRRGDTLEKIARMFNTTVDALVKLNNISNPNKIWAGQIILY